MSSSFQDPYQPPTLTSAPVGNGVDVETFRHIAFWQKFFAILLYIGTGLTMVFLLAQIAMGAASGQTGAIIGGLIGAIFGGAIMVLIYLIPAMRLSAAAQATREFGEGRLSVSEYAAHQKGFWRYTGIVVSVVLAIYLVIFVVAILLGVLVGMR